MYWELRFENISRGQGLEGTGCLTPRFEFYSIGLKKSMGDRCFSLSYLLL